MDNICHVCGQPLDEIYPVSCIRCGRRVHFRTADSQGNDCCRILTQLSLCGLAFICNLCDQHASSIDEVSTVINPLS